MKNKIIIGAVVVAGALGFFIFGQKDNVPGTSSQGEVTKDLSSVSEITHGHGLAVDIADPSKLYIATHHGLLVLINEKDLYRVGESEDDYMGFSPHPTNPEVLFTSGHPKIGGNLGVQRSEDGGITWNKISNGASGPVDFHAMTVSPANPDTLYGWYMGALQRSIDGGENWEIVTRNLPNIISLASSPTDENTVFAATANGLMISENNGKDWENLSTDLSGSAVTALSISPQDAQEILSFSAKLGLEKSNDGGKTWEKIEEGFGGEAVLHIAISKNNPQIIYALTQENSLYKSNDSGTSWDKIR